MAHNPSSLFKNHEVPFEGFYINKALVKVQPYQAPDYSQMAWVFSGQGQKVDALARERVRQNAAFSELIATADTYLAGLTSQSESLSRYFHEDSEASPLLHSTALFVYEVGLARCLLERGLKPRALTGFSFGEFASLVTAGILSFEDMLEFVIQREHLSPAPHGLGAMIVVRKSREAIKEALPQQNFHLSNMNSPLYTVITCKIEDKDSLLQELRRQRVAAQWLSDVPQPYHSPLLKTLSEKLVEFTQQRSWKVSSCRFPVYSSVLKTWIDAPLSEKELKSLLVRQVVEPVNFIQQSEALQKQGCISYLELGPGQVCSEHLAQNLPGHNPNMLRLDDFFPVRAVRPPKTYKKSLLKSPIFQLVNRGIAKVTGYKVEEIQIEERFQDDLGIDSLKKAEIIFEVLEESKAPVGEDFNTAQFETVGDLVQYLDDKINSGEEAEDLLKMGAKKVFKAYQETWEASDNQWPVSKERPLKQIHLSEIITQAQEATQDIDSGTIIHVHNDLEQQATETFSSPVLELLTALQSLVPTWDQLNCRILLTYSQPNRPLSRALVGLFKTLKKEFHDLYFKPICWESAEPLAAEVIQKEMADPYFEDVWYPQPSTRLTRSFHPVDLPKVDLPSYKKILAIGGAKGVALSLLKQAPLAKGCRIVLVGRSQIRSKEVQDALEALKQKYDRVEYHSCDARDKNSLKKVFAAAGSPFDLILNAAGVDLSQPFLMKSQHDMKLEASVKIQSTQHLFELAHEFSCPQVALFSSISGLFGNEGQSLYAFANEWITAEALRHKKVKAQALHWPAWDNTGMTTSKAVQLALAAKGVALISPEQAQELFWPSLRQAARSITYLSPEDKGLYASTLCDLKLLNTTLGPLKSLRHRRFAKTLNTDNMAYTQDHQVQGRPCLPAASAVAYFYSLARMLGRHPVVLRDFSMLNMLFIKPQSQTLFIELREHKDTVQAWLKTQIPLASADIPEELSLPPSTTSLEDESLLKSASPIYGPGRLFHGPLLQIIDHLGVTKDGYHWTRLLAKPKGVFTGQPDHDLLIHLIDGAFQLVGIEGMQRGEPLGLPRTIERVTIFCLPPREALVQVAIRSFMTESELLKAHLEIADAHRVYIRLEGVTLQKVQQ